LILCVSFQDLQTTCVDGEHGRLSVVWRNGPYRSMIN
jgi:hypothetical protein